MTMQNSPILLDGDALARTVRADLAARTAALVARGGPQPCLATILVGENPASATYVARKHADCLELGYASRELVLPARTSQAELIAHVGRFNADPACHGVLVQFPLPDPCDPVTVQEAVDPAKDVDGLHPLNLGRMLARRPALRPCTPAAVLALLAAHKVPLAGKRVAIIGRGGLVGAPLAVMLADPAINAVPTLLHRGAGDLGAVLRESDVIVAAAGVPDLVRADMVRPGACVVGVGITWGEGGVVSDLAADVAQVAGWITPPHGSVGAMTRAMLMANVLEAASAAFDEGRV